MVSNPHVPMETWKEAQTEDGEVYYYNPATGQSSWEIPSGARIVELYANGSMNVSKNKIESYSKSAGMSATFSDADVAEYQRRKKYTLSGEEAQSAFRTPIIASIIVSFVNIDCLYLVTND